MKLFQQFKQFLGGSQSLMRLVGILAIALLISLSACSKSEPDLSLPSLPIRTNLGSNLSPIKTSAAKITIQEVAPPVPIQKLSRYFDSYEPQVKILEPLADQVLNDTKVKVKFEVKDLPIFKSKTLGLGTHIHVILDNQEYKAAYDLSQPLVFTELTPGTHTIRAFASRPWHESFKNEGAFAQTTFHVYTKTGENTPNPQLPLLTYSRPVGTYGAEPIMLDFYLQHTPLHAALLEAEASSDWQIQATVNGQSFKVDQWQPVYLTGLKKGLNWLKLEFLDAQGHVVPNQFNSTAHVIKYEPNGKDTLSRLVRGEEIKDIESIVNPDYVLGSQPVVTPSPATPEPSPTPVEPILPIETVTPEPAPPEVKIPEPIASPTPESLKSVEIPVAPAIASPVSEPTPKPLEPIVPEVEATIPPTPVIQATPVEPIAPVESPQPPTTSTSQPVEIPSPEKIAPKPLKGLESLNLGERLKQAREKKTKPQNSDVD